MSVMLGPPRDCWDSADSGVIIFIQASLALRVRSGFGAEDVTVALRSYNSRTENHLE